MDVDDIVIAEAPRAIEIDTLLGANGIEVEKFVACAAQIRDVLSLRADQFVQRHARLVAAEGREVEVDAFPEIKAAFVADHVAVAWCVVEDGAIGLR